MYSVSEVAEKLKVSDSTIYNEVRRGHLQASKVGKRLVFTEDHINNYLMRGETIMSGNGGRALVVAPASQMPTPDDLASMLKLAEIYAKSDLVPKEFQGKVGNVFIAMEFAYRVGMNVQMVMQNLQIIHGHPGWSGQMAIALVNSSGLFDRPLAFDFGGDGDDYGCTAYTFKNGVRVDGPKVDWKMVKAEGWDQNKGSMKSKWKTMPTMMFPYRAGTYFARTICPQVLLGLQTVEELEDLGLEYDAETTCLPPLQERGKELAPPAEGALDKWNTMVAGFSDEGRGRMMNFLAELAPALQTTEDYIKAEALKEGNWPSFMKSFEEWCAKQPGDVESTEATSSEAPQSTISGEPEQSPTEETDQGKGQDEAKDSGQNKGPTQAQIIILKKEASRVSLAEADICKKMGVSSYEALTPGEYSEALLWLKNIKS